MSLENNTTTNREFLNQRISAIENELSGELITTKIVVDTIDLSDDLDGNVGGIIQSETGQGYLELNTSPALGNITTLANGDLSLVLDGENDGIQLIDNSQSSTKIQMSGFVETFE